MKEMQLFTDITNDALELYNNHMEIKEELLYKEVNDKITFLYDNLRKKECIEYIQKVNDTLLLNDTSKTIVLKLGLCPKCLSSFNSGTECYDCMEVFYAN